MLVVGKAGVGKTSLMHYISYKWAKNELWNDVIDFVFRVRLKDLNSGW
ncbi:MAG: NACHT domain-containing protein [bacterium]